MNKVPNRIMNQELEKKLYELFSLHRFGMKPGLDRILKLLQSVGNPHSELKTIHVAGTNGKGSVSSMLASILTEAGIKTGLYTSPHILKFNERIRIDGKPIDDYSLSEIAGKYLKQAEITESTFFEITTAIAFDYFAGSGVDIAIIECGMGGLNDATNVITPILSIITNVTLEHTEYLGDTIEKIAADKSGIIKQGVPVVCGNMSAVAFKVISQKAEILNSKLIDSKSDVEIVSISPYIELNRDIQIKNRDSILYLEFSLPGQHQVDNLTTALAAVNVIQKEITITDLMIENGIRNINHNSGLRARIELIRKDPVLILDTAHNPAGIESLCAAVLESYRGRKFNIVFAAMRDKDIPAMLKYLIPIASSFIIAELRNDRAASGKAIGEMLSDYGVDYEICDVEVAISKAFTSADNYLFTGTFYLAEQVMKYIEEKNISNQMR